MNRHAKIGPFHIILQGVLEDFGIPFSIGQRHNLIVIRESAGCCYVYCTLCKQRGPKKHSKKMALFRYHLRGFLG